MDIAIGTTGAQSATKLDRLATLLVHADHCDAKAIERARRVAAETGQRLDQVLIQLGLVSERAMAEAYADLFGFPLATPDRYPAEAPLLAGKVKALFLRNARAMPVALAGDTLAVAVTDPFDDFTPAAIAAATGHIVVREIAVPVEIEAALGRLYRNEESSAEAPAEENDAAGEDFSPEDTERLKDLASEAPVIRLVNQIISRAVETQASDIHIEPFETQLRIRYRRDGELEESERPPPRLTAAIVSRIKIMARLDIAQRGLPQDGRIQMTVRGHDVDFRVSTIPTLYGETVVLRVLDRSSVVFDFARLGLPEGVVHHLRQALALPDGIVLITGPTGSGKTTTLYASLLALNTTTRKIITVEDPIEYQLFGINQSQVKPQIGLTFSRLLRAILRQDPNVIMVGEIRDLETAEHATQLALTGRLVLSTLHTNSAAATVARLRDMGLDDYLMTAVLRAVLAQRLVRRLCIECRRPFTPSPELVRRFDLQRRCEGTPTLYEPVGCPQCRNTGYRGRQAIVEIMTVDATIKRLVLSRADHAEIEQAAVQAGMTRMFDAGLTAALAGVTTIEEVMRAIQAEG
jgi:general secretion pathway protein E